MGFKLMGMEEIPNVYLCASHLPLRGMRARHVSIPLDLLPESALDFG